MKIRIKKVTALFLSCMLLFSISGCQKKRTAKEVLESSLKQSSKLKDADFSGEASYKIANSEASSSSNVTIKMNFDTKLQTVDKDQLKMSMTYSKKDMILLPIILQIFSATTPSK